MNLNAVVIENPYSDLPYNYWFVSSFAEPGQVEFGKAYIYYLRFALELGWGLV